MVNLKNKYYIRVNENGIISKYFSSVFEKPTETDILIGEGEGSQFRATSDKLSVELQEFADIENGLQLTNEFGVYILKYENGVISKISDKELEESLLLQKPSPTEIELLQEENLRLMEATTNLYEKTLKLEEENLDIMMAMTELYEMSLES